MTQFPSCAENEYYGPSVSDAAYYQDVGDPDFEYEDTGFTAADRQRAAARSGRGVKYYYELEHEFNPAKALESAVSTIAKPIQSAINVVTSNPLFDIAKQGVAFIPGVGQAVSGGMAALAAAGKGASLKDIGLAAAKNALPGGAATAAALDAAVGALQGKNVADSVLNAVKEQVPGGELGKAAFEAGKAIARGEAFSDVALNAIKRNVPGGTEGIKVFNKAIEQYRKAKSPKTVTFPQMGAEARRTTAQLQRMGKGALSSPMRTLAKAAKVPVNTVREVASSFLNKWAGQPLFSLTSVGEMDSIETAAMREGIPIDMGDFETDVGEMSFMNVRTVPKVQIMVPQELAQKMYDLGTANIRKALLAHGILARVAQSTGELDSTGGWVIRSGDTGYGIAKKVTGDGNRWRELLSANPGMTTYTDSGGSTQIKPWKIGQRVILPASWLGTAAPAPAALPTTIPGITAIPGLPQILSQIPTTIPELPIPTPTAPTAPTPAPSAAPSGQTYVVQSGDSLSKIAKRFTGDSARWTELYAMPANKKTIGSDPNKIFPGQRLILPGTWAAPTPATIPTLPSVVPLPTVPGPAVPSHAPDVAIGAIQAQLAFFYSRHGNEIPRGLFASSSVPTFGSDPDDLAGVWNDRSIDATLGFQAWNNAQPGGSQLQENGEPDQPTVAALQKQVAADIAAMGGGAVPAPTPSVPTIPTLPTIPTVPTIPAVVKPPTTPAQPKPGAPPPTAKASAGGGGILLLAAGAAALLLMGKKGRAA